MSNVHFTAKTFRLHPAQQDVFIDQLINNDSPQYNIGGYIILKGKLNKKILHTVVNTAPTVFDAFKMRFDANAPEMIGYIDEDEFIFDLNEWDFSKEQNAADVAFHWMQGKMNQPFTLRKTDRLFEQALLTIAADEHWLFGRFHHLIMDGYGFSIWMRYMADKYRSVCTSGSESFFFPSYIDEVVTTNTTVPETAVAADDNYWKQRLQSKSKQLFHSKNISALNEAPASNYTYRLTAVEKAELESLAQSLQAGVHQITIAALLVYFSKMMDAEKVIFGLPVHKRNSRKLRNIIGLFNGFIPFVGDYKSSQTVAGLVRSIVVAQSADYRHQHVNISNINRHLGLNPAEQSLWEIIVNYLPFNLELHFGNELQASIYRMVNEYESIPLQVCWNDYGRQQPLELQIHFLKKYFSETEIRFFTNRLLHILSQFATDINKTVNEITVLPVAELVMLKEFGRTKSVEPIYQKPIPFANYLVQVWATDEQLAGIGVDGKLCLLGELSNEQSSTSPGFINTGVSVRWTPEGELVKVEETPAPINDYEKPALQALPVSICATFVAEMLEEYINYWSSEFELNLKVHFAPYNQVFQQLLYADSLLNEGEGINIVLICVEDWIREQLNSPADEQISLLQTTCEQFLSALLDARKFSTKPYLFGIIPWVLNTALHPQVQETIKEITEKLSYYLAEIYLFYELDLYKAIELYEVQEIFDTTTDEAGHIPFTDECFAAIGTYITRKVRAWQSPAYKVIALDCDNTLWKGICGEVGPMNVLIDTDYKYLQQFLIRKYTEGFLLVLCSKNNEEDVWEVFDHHPGMKLKREHITAYKIDWQPKPANLQSIAAGLNLATDSFIFLDDSAFEVEQMEMACPEVLSLALPIEESIPAFLEHTWAFDLFSITEEDKQRNTTYKAEKQRQEEGTKFGIINDFIITLGVEITVRKLSEIELERAVQLTLRTNQFNLNGIRKSHAEVAGLIVDNQSINWILEVSDRFGNYGITGLVLAKQVHNELVLNTFLLSCRVLGRNVEDKLLTVLTDYCTKNSLHGIRAVFYATGKNKPFIEFLNRTNWIADTGSNDYCFPINHSGGYISHTFHENQTIQ